MPQDCPERTPNFAACSPRQLRPVDDATTLI
jgi:hypothetical protein